MPSMLNACAVRSAARRRCSAAATPIGTATTTDTSSETITSSSVTGNACPISVVIASPLR